MEGSDDPSADGYTRHVSSQCAYPQGLCHACYRGPLRKHGRSCAPRVSAAYLKGLRARLCVHAVISPSSVTVKQETTWMPTSLTRTSRVIQVTKCPNWMQGSKAPCLPDWAKGGREQTQHPPLIPYYSPPWTFLVSLVPQTESKLKS